MEKLPLEGVRALELTTGAAGPTVGKMLCDFGAEVILVETRVRGDAHRGTRPEVWNTRPDFIKLHRGKKSLNLNMATEQGKLLVREVIKHSDVLIENFGFGALERWDLDYPKLTEINPSIILARVKGLGTTGPHAADLTYGPNVVNLFGSTHLWNLPDSKVLTGEARTQHPDFMGGVTGAFGVVLALMQRRKTGRGQWIDSSQLEIGASLLGPRYLELTVNGRDPEPLGNTSLVAAPYGAYRCQGDDRWCVIAAYTQDEWERLAGLLGESALSGDGRFATHLQRVRNKGELDRLVESWTSERDPYDVMETLQGIGVAAAVVQDVEDQFKRDAQYAARGFLTAIVEPEAGEIITEGIPVRLSETPGKVRGPAPLMGQHTREISRDLMGLSDEEIGSLVEEGVLV